MRNHDFYEILNAILSPRREIGIKHKYYLFELSFPDRVISIAERRCPYCGKQFRNVPSIKNHLVHSRCAFNLKQDFMFVESLYSSLRECLNKYRKKLSGIELLLHCIKIAGGLEGWLTRL